MPNELAVVEVIGRLPLGIQVVKSNDITLTGKIPCRDKSSNFIQGDWNI